MYANIPPQGIRLNLGCGNKVLDGWLNVDVAVDPTANRQPDMLSAADNLVELPDHCVSELMALHLWEHFYRWECEGAIAEWHRVLKPGGLLVMEMPDLFKFCQNIVDGRTKGRHEDDLGLWGMWGDPRPKNILMCHHWGWTFSTLAPFLAAHGFTDCREEETQFHRVGKRVRDFRITAKRV